jgi:hypothetical protein
MNWKEQLRLIACGAFSGAPAPLGRRPHAAPQLRMNAPHWPLASYLPPASASPVRS